MHWLSSDYVDSHKEKAMAKNTGNGSMAAAQKKTPDGSTFLSEQAKRESQLYQDGIREGRRVMGRDLLSYLEGAYLSDPKINRTTPEGKAILQVAADAAAYLRRVRDE